MNRSESELLAAAREGERWALEQLLERFGPAVRATLKGKISSRWQSLLSEDDVMQETYADAALSIASYVDTANGSFLGWLSQIAHHNLLDAVRGLESQRRGGQLHRTVSHNPRESSDALLNLIDSGRSSIRHRAMKNEAVEQMLEAIEQLPTAYREIVCRFDLEGQSARQIASELQCSEGAVYMRRIRAHQLLREWLRGQE